MKLEELKCISGKSIDIDKYIEFREQVKKHMKYPEWLGDFSKKDLINMVENKAKIWLYYLNNEPVCSIMLIPADEKALFKLWSNVC